MYSQLTQDRPGARRKVSDNRDFAALQLAWRRPRISRRDVVLGVGSLFAAILTLGWFVLTNSSPSPLSEHPVQSEPARRAPTLPNAAPTASVESVETLAGQRRRLAVSGRAPRQLRYLREGGGGDLALATPPSPTYRGDSAGGGWGVGTPD